MIKDPFLRKWHDLKYLYGVEAAEYFKAHPSCERCPEKRIAALTVHHTKGKLVNEFETLCFNCHMLHHAKHKEFTYEDHLKFVEYKANKSVVKMKRYQEIAERWKQVKNLQIVAKEFGISHMTVRYALVKCGVLA